MRIGLVIYGSLDILTGGYLYDKKLVDYLRSRGDEVEIVSLPWRSYSRCLLDNFSKSLYKRFCNGSYDVLIQDELNHPSLFWLNRKLQRTVDYPLVTIVHLLRCTEPRPAWLNLMSRWVERQYLLSVNAGIWNSEDTRAVVTRVAGSERPGMVAYPGRDHLSSDISQKEIEERARKSGPLQVLFIGNVIPRKGLHTMIEALSSLPKNEWRLTVIGSLDMDTRYVRYIRRQIAESETRENVKLLGALPHDQVAAYLKGSHVLAVPSLYEAFGIVYLEGMAFGLPIIASTAGAADELITDNMEGFLVEPGNAKVLSERLSELSLDRGRLAQMGTAAKTRYEDFPTWAETSAKIRDFLAEMVG